MQRKKGSAKKFTHKLNVTKNIIFITTRWISNVSCIGHRLTFLFHYSELKAGEVAVMFLLLIIAVCWDKQRSEFVILFQITPPIMWRRRHSPCGCKLVQAALSGGPCHHQHDALTCCATTWKSEVAADWHLITETHSSFTTVSRISKGTSISSFPAIVSVLVRLYCLDPCC